MISKAQAQLENEHIRKIAAYSPPEYTYIGLFILPDVELDGSGTLPSDAEPDTSTGYKRLKIPNSSASWEVYEQNKIRNKVKLQFEQEFTSDAGIARYIFEFDESRNIYMYYEKLVQEIILYQNMTIFFDEHDIVFERTNPV